MSAAWFWGRNKRAAIASLICGGANLCASLLTNYPGGVRSVISFRRHGEIDLGLAAMAASMPEFLAFEDDAEKKFFLAQGALMTAIHETTEFPEETSFRERVLEKTRAA